MSIPHRQLKSSQIANARAQYAAKQKYTCPICLGNLAIGRPTLDHCHRTGHIRATLCSICNLNEGKVFKAMRYMAPKTHRVWIDPCGWLRALADYLEHHQGSPSGLIHPSFDVAKGRQKPVKRKKKPST